MFSNKTVTFLTQEALSHMQLFSPSHLLRNDLSCGVFSSQGLLRPQKISPHHQITQFPSNCCYISKIKTLLGWIFLHMNSPMELNRLSLVSAPRIAQKTASPQTNPTIKQTPAAYCRCATTSMAIHLSHNNLNNCRDTY